VKIIALLAVMAMLLVDVLGSKSSVGGPMTDLLVAFLIMLVVGIYESRNCGPLGWIVNIVLAVSRAAFSRRFGDTQSNFSRYFRMRDSADMYRPSRILQASEILPMK
jgi:hypothetical protein